MRYQCVHCDETFEHASDERPRCPKCMRTHGIRALEANAAAAVPPSTRSRMTGLALGLALTAAVVLYLLLGRKPGVETPGETPSRSALASELQRLGVAESLPSWLGGDETVTAFAEKAAAGANGAAGKARAVTAALRKRAQEQAFVPWSRTDPRGKALMTVPETLAAIAAPNAKKQLYPFEVAALAVSALRALDVKAALAEASGFAGERAPADPSGRLGYFLVALPDKTEGGPLYLDPFGGRPELRKCETCAVLKDVEALGAALSLRALERLASNEDPALALRDTELAIKLLPSSPSVRSARGMVLLANAASDLARLELEAAAQLRPDGPRKNNLAMLSLATGDTERAAREVSQVLEREPEFASAHVTLAAIHLARGERDLSRAALEKAESIDPGLPGLPLTWAQYYASGGEAELAMVHARRAVDARPTDPQARLVLAQLYRQAARYEEMRGEARAVLALSPRAHETRMRELIERVLGPTALSADVAADEPSAGDSPPDPAQASPAAPSLGSGLRLRDPGLDPSTGTLNPKGDAPKLQLKQPGSRIDLGREP